GSSVRRGAVRAARRPASRLAADSRDVAVGAETLERAVDAALSEDVGEGDVTTEATVDEAAVATAVLVLREAGVVCGLRAAELVFRALDPGIEFEGLVEEGASVGDEDVDVARVTGATRAILTGERTALNFL